MRYYVSWKTTSYYKKDSVKLADAGLLVEMETGYNSYTIYNSYWVSMFPLITLHQTLACHCCFLTIQVLSCSCSCHRLTGQWTLFIALENTITKSSETMSTDCHYQPLYSSDLTCNIPIIQTCGHLCLPEVLLPLSLMASIVPNVVCS